MLTQSELKSNLHYDPSTGIFTRLKSMRRDLVGKQVGSLVYYPTSSNTYCMIGLNGKTYRAHRLAFLYMTGTIPELIDHEDGNGINNAWNNLKASDFTKNQRNKRKLKNNTSGVTGVTFHTQNKVWQARIGIGGKKINLGSFKTLEEAKQARLEAQQRLRFTKRHGI